jgi:hypothetical protein
LNLTRNGIGWSGAEAIAVGTEALARALERNTTLTRVDFGGNIAERPPRDAFASGEVRELWRSNSVRGRGEKANAAIRAGVERNTDLIRLCVRSRLVAERSKDRAVRDAVDAFGGVSGFLHVVFRFYLPLKLA